MCSHWSTEVQYNVCFLSAMLYSPTAIHSLVFVNKMQYSTYNGYLGIKDYQSYFYIRLFLLGCYMPLIIHVCNFFLRNGIVCDGKGVHFSTKFRACLYCSCWVTGLHKHMHCNTLAEMVCSFSWSILFTYFLIWQGSWDHRTLSVCQVSCLLVLWLVRYICLLKKKNNLRYLMATCSHCMILYEISVLHNSLPTKINDTSPILSY